MSKSTKMSSKYLNRIVIIVISFALPSTLIFVNGQEPICIVGAGISGLNLGQLLQEKNEKIVIFEKFNKVGGKMDIFRENDNVQVSIGPVFFPLTHDKILNQIKKYKLTPIPFNDSKLAAFEPYTGMVLPAREIMSTRKVQYILYEAAHRYGQYQSVYKKNGIFDFGFLKASSVPEVFEPLSKWLHDRQLDILNSIFRGLMTEEGYGGIHETPALYALKFVDESILTDVILNPHGGLYTLYEGYDVLANKMADPLNVQLQEEVVEIVRHFNSDPNLDRQTVTTKNHLGQLTKHKCRKVILAYPPLHMDQLVKDLTSEERQVLGQIRTIKYAVGVHEIPTWSQSMYGNIGATVNPAIFNKLMGNGNAILFVKQSFKGATNVFTSYTWIKGEFTLVSTVNDIQLMEQKLNMTLRRLDGAGELQKVKTLLRLSQKHPYFPHVNTRVLKSGFYEKFDKIQGHGGLYYATTLLGFECMNFAIEMTQDFVSKYF